MPDQTDSGDPADILLVEDNPGDVRLTKEAFKEENIANTLHVATDGIEALDFLYKRDEYADASCPDIVLLDLNLPRKNGDEVLEEITDDPDLSHVPVIILTSSAAEEDIIKSYELQANAYLTKPVDPEEFIQTMQSFQQFWLSVVRLPPCERESKWIASKDLTIVSHPISASSKASSTTSGVGAFRYGSMA